MIEKINGKEIITYLIAGVLTVLVSLGVCKILGSTILNPEVVWQNAVIHMAAWAILVLLGFLAARRVVYKSNYSKSGMEFVRFAVDIILIGAMYYTAVFCAVNIFHMGQLTAGILAASGLFVANYVLCKLFVFNNGKSVTAVCREIFAQYEEILTYLVVGVLTTIVSWVTCWIFEATILNPDVGWENGVINSFGWLAGVLFGYVTNRKYVFKSTNPNIKKEFFQFAGSRVSTWILDIAIMYVTVNMVRMDYWTSKIFISSILVMIANYVFSKIFVFKKDKKDENPS